MIEKPPTLWLPPKPAIIRAWKREDIKRATFPFPFFVPASSVPPATCAFVVRSILTTNVTTYNFGSLSIGTAATDRVTIIQVSWGDSSRTLSSVSLDGNTMTIVRQLTATDGVAIVILATPTSLIAGTSATVSVVLSAGAGAATVAIYRADAMLSTTQTDADDANNTGGNPSLTLDVAAGGFVIAGALNNTAGTDMTFVGAAETYDESDGDGSAQRVGGGMSSGLSAETGRTISVTGGATRTLLIAASFR